MRSLLIISLLATSALAHAGKGNTAKLLTTGEHAFNARRRNIERADVIFYKTYIFGADETGRETVDLLAQKAREGKRVIVEYDVKGSARSVRELMQIGVGLRSPIPAHLQPLVEAGATLIPTNKPTLRRMFLGRDHDKLLVTWKEGEAARAMLGGMNVANEYAWSGRFQRKRKPQLAFRDTDVELTGPVVKSVMDRIVDAARHGKADAYRELVDARAQVSRDDKAFEPVRGQNADVRFIANDPKDGRAKRRIEAEYERLLEQTPNGDLVTLSNSYFLPTRRFQRAMLRAAERGVRFRLIVNAPDVPEAAAQTVSLALRDQLRTLFRKIGPEQLEVIEWHGNEGRNEGALHQKIGRFGVNGPVLVGSANLDPLSANHNSEAVVVIDHPEIGKQFDALINRQLREGDTRRLSGEDLARDSVWRKLKGFVLHRFLGRFL